MSEDPRPAESPPWDPGRRTTTPQERLLLLDLWQRSGLTGQAFGALVGVSKATLFGWKDRFKRGGPAALQDHARGAPTGSRLSEVTQRAIVLVKTTHPVWGCERIRGRAGWIDTIRKRAISARSNLTIPEENEAASGNWIGIRTRWRMPRRGLTRRS
jgi:transposase